MRSTDRLYKYLTAAVAGITLVAVVIPGVSLAFSAYGSLVVNGLAFFTTTVWRSGDQNAIVTVKGVQTLQGSSYGVIVFVSGTLASSAIALLLAIPTGLGVAIFLSRIAPRRLAGPISFAVELLAGIPSVIYGFWGFAVLGPFLLNTLEPFLADHLSFLPIFKGPFSSSGGLLTAGIILAIMVVPIVASISRDVMAQTPSHLTEGAKALGLTRWEITRRVVLPYARTGIIGSVVLGLGRALGETMAVAMVAGTGVQLVPQTLFYPVSTIAAFLALSLNSAFTDPSGMNVSALMELALVLLAITFVVNIVARLLIKQGFASKSDTIVRV
ncbi:MAG TPA: phosphate ABC transporter permease subunit PstC [Candidatus Bathyarchaeia archaeon]|jgi:phosphate transport system permease protein|nr:phosphate ABC transporter permease subunit PstC [Candidatus Bathyarchaeia archaeon]